MAYSRGGGGDWWDGTWNPVGGCSAASTGCKNCYAQLQAGTLHKRAGAKRRVVPLYEGTTDQVKGRPVFNGYLTALPPGHDTWTWPLTWPGALLPRLGVARPSLIFVGDMADLFHQNRSTEIIDRVVGTIATSPHIGLLLTKRAEVMTDYFSRAQSPTTQRRRQAHLWLGFSAERQQEFDQRWPAMRALAGAGWTVFVSIAPMIGPVTLSSDFQAYGDRAWVICSGEQGRGARDMDPSWARAVRDQCAEAGVAFFMKQMAGKKPISRDLLIRQFPARY